MKAIYDQRYLGDYRADLSGYEVARWQALRQFLANVLDVRAAKRVLDFGAGSGLHVGLWEQVFPGAELCFCDISSVAMDKFTRKFPRYAGAYSLVRENRTAFADNLFDVIVSVEVMEHVEDLTAYLAAVHRLLKPGGYFVWTTPCANPLSIEHIFSLLTGKIEATAEGYRRWSWEDPTHLRRLKSKEIEGVLANNGFSDICFRFRSHLFSFICTYFPAKGLHPLRNKLMTLDYTLFRRLPNGASMIGAARKRAGPDGHPTFPSGSS